MFLTASPTQLAVSCQKPPELEMSSSEVHEVATDIRYCYGEPDFFLMSAPSPTAQSELRYPLGNISRPPKDLTTASDLP